MPDSFKSTLVPVLDYLYDLLELLDLTCLCCENCLIPNYSNLKVTHNTTMIGIWIVLTCCIHRGSPFAECSLDRYSVLDFSPGQCCLFMAHLYMEVPNVFVLCCSFDLLIIIKQLESLKSFGKYKCVLP